MKASLSSSRTLHAFIGFGAALLLLLIAIQFASRSACHSPPPGFAVVFCGAELMAARDLSNPTTLIIAASRLPLFSYGAAFVRSYIDVAARTTLEYAHVVVDLLVQYGCRSVLLLGLGGGGAIPMLYAGRCPDGRLTAVHGTDEAVRIARQFVYPDDNVTTQYLAQCPMQFVGAAPTGGYDAVVNNLGVGADPPAFVYDGAFVRNVSRVLRPGGQYIMNLAMPTAAYGGEARKAYEAVCDVMPDVAVAKIEDPRSMVLFASRTPDQPTSA